MIRDQWAMGDRNLGYVSAPLPVLQTPFCSSDIISFDKTLCKREDNESEVPPPDRTRLSVRASCNPLERSGTNFAHLCTAVYVFH